MVAMLCSILTGIPYSLTIHGPGEFDRPTLLALDEKIRHAAFVVAITEFTRSQLYRWADYVDWPKIHVDPRRTSARCSWSTARRRSRQPPGW